MNIDAKIRSQILAQIELSNVHNVLATLAGTNPEWLLPEGIRENFLEKVTFERTFDMQATF